MKTGLYANKGHCVSLPQPLNEAKQLPRLPAEVNIIILKRVGADDRIKHYFAKRVCYGFPHGGCDEPNEMSTETYIGRNHSQLPLNGQYFQYIPNPYNCDVEIIYDRLNKLPQESSLWSGLAVIERPNKNHDNDPVEHPLNPDPEEPLWI